MTENTSSSEITPLSGEQLNDLVASFDASQSNRLAMNAVTAAGIDTLYSPFVEKDTLLKFSHVSPMAACGQYYHVKAGAMQKPGEIRECFIRLVGEILELARAMGIELDDKPDAPLMQSHLKILDDLAESASTSMQRDIEAGKNSEVDGLIYQVVRLADKYGLACPEYRKVAQKVKAELAEK